MRLPRRKLLSTLLGGLAACGPAALAVQDAGGDFPGLTELAVRRIEEDRPRVRVFTETVANLPRPTRLLLVVSGEPIGWFDCTGEQDGRITWVSTSAPRLPEAWQDPRAWAIGPGLPGSLLERWPARAPLLANIDSVGPGARSVWIDAGRDLGIQPGDAWWLRVGGQPVARFDVRLVAGDVSFAAVAPLVADSQFFAGDRVSLWPNPGQRRRGQTRSAVSFIETQGRTRLVWVAAPPHAAVPPEPQLDFYHKGRFVGHGLVEQQDPRFWYARFWPATGSAPPAPASQPQLAQPTTDASAASRPVEVGEVGLEIDVGETPRGVAVGDDVIVRTVADIEHRRFVAHVFEHLPDGYLVNAGEQDGIELGNTAQVYRDGALVDSVTVTKVQRTYALVRPARGESLQAGDEVRLMPPPRPPTVLGTIRALHDAHVFRAELTGRGAALLTPLSIQLDGQTVGVAVLLYAGRGGAIGLALESSLAQRLAIGMELVQGTDAEEAQR